MELRDEGGNWLAMEGAPAPFKALPIPKRGGMTKSNTWSLETNVFLSFPLARVGPTYRNAHGGPPGPPARPPAKGLASRVSSADGGG